MAAEAKKLVDQYIAENKVVVFSKSYCPFCQMAKAALNETGVKYFVLELEDRSDCDAIQDYLLSLTNGRSVPRVFVAGNFIGGGSEVKGLQQNGKLLPMLQEAGAL